MSDLSSFQTLNLSQVQGDLLKLYERIACEKGRVEIHSGSGSCQCVLISKAELDTLENAIAALSDMEHVKNLTARLVYLADVAGPQQAGA